MDIRNELISVVDSLIKNERINQIKRDILYKENKIKNITKKCGSCSLWMTKNCPKEKHTKVSCEMRTCNSFKKDFWIDKTIEEWKLEIHELQLLLNGL